MSTTFTGSSASRAALRLWPGIVLGGLLLLFRYVLPLISGELFLFGMAGGAICAVLIVVWWLPARYYGNDPSTAKAGSKADV